jgi:hypothetical protein
VNDVATASPGEVRVARWIQGLWPWGCLLGASLVALLATAGVVVLCFWLFWSTPGGGVAGAEAVRPLPAGLVEVAERAECFGSGDGWKQCERRLRVRREGVARHLLQAELVAHYQMLGHTMRRFECPTQNCPAEWGEQSCRRQEPSADVLCLSISDPGYMLDDEWRGLPPHPDDVDIVATTWSYFI